MPNKERMKSENQLELHEAIEIQETEGQIHSSAHH